MATPESPTPAADTAQELIDIEVAYARPDSQLIIPLQVPRGTTLQQAVELSGIAERYKEIAAEPHKMGIFGKIAKPDQVLRAGDRVEIYRPLIADPKQARKKRAAKKKAQ